MKKEISRFHSIVLCFSILLSLCTPISAVVSEEDFLNQFEEIDQIGYFKNDSVELYYNPVQEPDKKVLLTQSAMPESFTVQYRFTQEDGVTQWYIIDSENWLEISEDGAYPGYVSVDDVTFTEPGSVCITDINGTPVSELVLTMYEKTALVAQGDGDVAWQILADDIWVNIQGANDARITVNYGLVASLLDGDGAAWLRCTTVSSGKRAFSEPIRVVIQPEAVALAMMEEMPIPLTAGVADPTEQAASLDAGETHSIIIEYVFADGTQAANTWTATVAAGSSYSGTVTSPDVLGYEPDRSEVSLQYDAVEQDETITVTYKPAQVEYTVIHYQQNLDDDGYTVAERETKTGYTESEVGAGLAKEYEGFYALLYVTDTKIAADGSTEVEIYYDRFYYLMSFGLDGGYGVEPIYARYGAPLEIGEPTKEGFQFGGWEDADSGEVYGIDEFPYQTMPAQNTTFVAQWTGTEVTFDVVYWYENADDNSFSQAGVQYDVSAVAGSVVDGATYSDYAFQGRDDEHFSYAFADSNVTVSGDGSTVVNVYFRRNIYTLTFVMGGWAASCSVAEHRHVLDENSEDSCYGFNCQIEEHDHETSGCELACSHAVHDITCWGMTEDNKTEKPDKLPVENPVSGTVYQYSYWGTHHYLFLNGKWYCQNNYLGDRESISLSCSHAHSAACYNCGKVNHVHSIDAGCYGLTCGKQEHYHENSTCYLVVTKKYDADITDIWANDPVDAVIEAGYVFQSSVTDDYYSFLQKMPGQDIAMTKYDMGSTTKYIYYYLEVLPGKDYSGVETREATKNGTTKTYYLYKTLNPQLSSGAYLTYEEDYFPITGFTQRDSDVPNFDSNKKAYLYYTRNSYTLTFSNNGSSVEGKGGTYLYEADISGAYFVPEYPDTLEPNAYVFDGWYTSPFFGDTKFEFTTTDEEGKTVNTTMPANDLTLYARWAAKEHNVRLFPTKDDMEAKTNQIGDTQIVAHRSTAVKPNDPVNGAYTFVGWFYMDGETEKAFDFSMPVTKDLDLYAKWSSNTLMQYTIRYAVENTDGTLTYIAGDSTGSALAGTTKTFDAKAGDQLFPDYQSGYFPVTSSHSLVIDINDQLRNEYTFLYVQKDKVPYTVKYLEKGTEQVLHEEKTQETANAVITENFEPVSGYMPDAYQKRLVLSGNAEENVIIFWYVADNEHAPVQIIHYIQNSVGDGYSQYQSSTDLNGVIGAQYSTSVLSIPGFAFSRATANKSAVEQTGGNVTGTVENSGLILEIYYDRVEYPYEFRFLEQGTNKVLADPVTGTARYGAQVTQSAKPVAGYTSSDDALELTVQIEDGGTAQKNVRIFYYTEQSVTIKYIAVGPEGKNFGYVSRAEETVKVRNGNALGAVATAEKGYRFVGWYPDQNCTKKVGDETAFIPGKNGELYQAATYYAKFERALADLTITKTGAQPIDENQSFIFTVKGEGIELDVVIAGNGKVTIKDLPIGTYTVTENPDWSWRYDPENDEDEQEITLTANGENTVSFSNTREKVRWLSGDSYCENRFNKVLRRRKRKKEAV